MDDPMILAVLFAVAAAAGFIDTLAGGGGLITVPALLLAQVPPIFVLPTNKLQSSSGTLTAAIMMLRSGLVSIADVRFVFGAASLGALVGAVAVQFVDTGSLDLVIPILLVFMALYFLLAPNAGEVDRAPRLGASRYRSLVVPAIGFYDGVFGPGTGSFFSVAGVALRGQNLVTATANAKVLNFATNIASLVVFAAGGKIVWVAGVAMMAGQVVGAYAGSRMVMRGGTRLIRPLIVTLCLLMLGRYVWQKGLLF